MGWDAWQHDVQEASAHESRMVQDGLTSAEAESAMADVLLSDAAGHLLVVKGDFDAAVGSVRPPATTPRRETRRPRPPAPSARRPTYRRRSSTPGDLLTRSGTPPRRRPAATRRGLTELHRSAGGPRRAAWCHAADRSDLRSSDATPSRDARGTAAGPAHPGTDRLPVRPWRSKGPMIWCLHPISGSRGQLHPACRSARGASGSGGCRPASGRG